MLRLGLLCFTVIAVQAQQTSLLNTIYSLAGKTYRESESPPYVVDPDYSGKDYEKRYYPSVKWVSTRGICDDMDICIRSSMAFMKLFRYIGGANSKGAKIEMTSPVLMAVDMRKSEDEKRTFEMSFYLPKAFQENTPLPSDSTVYVKTMPPMFIYAKTYSGWSTQSTAMSEREKLQKMLDKDEVGYYKEIFLSATYDGPDRWTRRRNEVWLISNEK